MFEDGSRVQVDMIGGPEPRFDDDVVGTVVHVSVGQGTVSVRLDEPFEGEEVVLKRWERVRSIG